MIQPALTAWRYRATTALLMGLACCAQAQTIYRHVGPDGRVTFSDRAPQTVQQASPAHHQRVIAADSDPLPELPNALRVPAARYPVVFYSFTGCASCDEARRFLRNKGIPFQERTVNTTADQTAFFKISPSGTMPVVTIGQQQLTGFDQGEWDSYLLAAGYPRSSVLPSGYQPPPAVALIAEPPAPAADAPAAQAESPTETESPRPPAAADNPAGIRF